MSDTVPRRHLNTRDGSSFGMELVALHVSLLERLLYQLRGLELSHSGVLLGIPPLTELNHINTG